MPCLAVLSSVLRWESSAPTVWCAKTLPVTESAPGKGCRCCRPSTMPWSCRACASPCGRILVFDGREEGRARICQPAAWQERTSRLCESRRELPCAVQCSRLCGKAGKSSSRAVQCAGRPWPAQFDALVLDGFEDRLVAAAKCAGPLLVRHRHLGDNFLHLVVDHSCAADLALAPLLAGAIRCGDLAVGVQHLCRRGGNRHKRAIRRYRAAASPPSAR